MTYYNTHYTKITIYYLDNVYVLYGVRYVHTHTDQGSTVLDSGGGKYSCFPHQNQFNKVLATIEKCVKNIQYYTILFMIHNTYIHTQGPSKQKRLNTSVMLAAFRDVYVAKYDTAFNDLMLYLCAFRDVYVAKYDTAFNDLNAVFVS